MSIRKSFGEKLAVLAKSTGKTQALISENLAMPPSQLNRFFKGRSDLTSSNLLLVLAELGINLEELIGKRIRKSADIDSDRIESKEDCLKFLFRSLDPIGQQTYLSNLAWAAKASSKKDLPENVVEILKQEINLI